MAQSVEHHLGKVEVPGSNPGNSSKIDDRRPVLARRAAKSFLGVLLSAASNSSTKKHPVRGVFCGVDDDSSTPIAL